MCYPPEGGSVSFDELNLPRRRWNFSNKFYNQTNHTSGRQGDNRNTGNCRVTPKNVATISESNHVSQEDLGAGCEVCFEKMSARKIMWSYV